MQHKVLIPFYKLVWSIYSKTAKLGKSGAALKAWVKKVGKSKVAAKNGCNDVNFNNNATAVSVKIY